MRDNCLKFMSLKRLVQKELKEAFRLYDKEGNGFIPTSCLKEILRELDDQLSDADLDGMINEIDSDGSGTVDFDGKLNNFKDSRMSHIGQASALTLGLHNLTMIDNLLEEISDEGVQQTSDSAGERASIPSIKIESNEL